MRLIVDQAVYMTEIDRADRLLAYVTPGGPGKLLAFAQAYNATQPPRTSKRSKTLTGYDYHETRAQMHARFPGVFTARGTPPVPLRVGISQDLRAIPDLGLTAIRLRKFMRAWTQRGEYQNALAAGGPRFDLDGTPAGLVTEDQVVMARREIARRVARQKAKVKATAEHG